MNRSAGNPLPDEPWPLSSRNLLSKRESKLYQDLIALYPDHKIFVQVALSQLINVDRNHPERDSIRARYKQLVADFVLCRPDLSVVAVIELDDRTHEWPKRKAADARKNKALADAGIRLVRIPAGRLPSEDELRALVDADGKVQEGAHEEAVLSLAESVDIYQETSTHGWREDASAQSRELKRISLKTIAGAIVLVAGWFIYSQFLPTVIQRASQPLADKPVQVPSAAPKSSPVTPLQIATVPVVSQPSAEELAETKRRQLQEVAALQNQKNLAWMAFYSAPASCEHPADWTAQVECGNQYMRTKKVFEQQWEAAHPSDQSGGVKVALNNGSAGGTHK